MDDQLLALYHRHVAAAFDRQMRLSNFLEREAPGAGWQYQTSTSTLEFGHEVRFEAHDLGSHANLDNSWLWVWCNPHLTLTPPNRELAAAVANLRVRSGIEAFTATTQFDVGPLLGPDLSEFAAHVFAIIVGGELGYHAHYTMPFDHGRFAVLIRDERLREDVPHPLVRVAALFPQLLSSYPVPDHRAAFLGYLDRYGCERCEDDNAVRVIEGEAEVMRAEFDHLNRMTKLTGTFQGHE